MRISQLFRTKFKAYLPLIKTLQTGLLLSTGVAGYMSAHTHLSLGTLLGLAGSLFLAISGSTILNMWYDADIDTVMNRTHNRPLASGQVTRREALWLGLLLSFAGVSWAISLNVLYGIVVFSGLFFDVIVYTIWLKRRTCWSIVWGGISGGMPILAGRVLAVGHIDVVGLLLMMAVLFWIPTHILTYTMRYYDDYQAAGVPTFPSSYGFDATRAIIALSAIIAAASIGVAGVMIGIQAGALRLMAVLSSGLLLLSVVTVFRPSEQVNFSLFKYASIYMLASMILLSL
ncbi:MAG: protoheme IX farnesyltransferase [Anaerolineales bacterium]|nr:protoheme IX farnesyltransferase [Anaerolineae bacterium]PWB54611.1 MAG: protoheme IX farnesyltransferase [Anaerolineales bacterium]